MTATDAPAVDLPDSLIVSSPHDLLDRVADRLNWSATAMVVALMTILAAVVRFVGIGHQSYWYDEAHTLSLIHLPIGQLYSQIRQTETCPPLYYLVAAGWGRIFGYGEAGLRSLSAVAGVLTVPIGYHIGKKALSKRAGLIAGALIAFNPFLVWYSQEARPYALMALLTAVALLAFVHIIDRPTRRWAFVWVGASAAAIATHYYAALVLVPQGIWLITRYWGNRSIRTSILSVLPFAALLLPLALAQLQGPHWNWISREPLISRVEGVDSAFAVGPGAPWEAFLVLIANAAVAIADWLLLRRADADERRSALTFALLAISGLTLVAVSILFGYDQLDARNMIGLWLPVALFIAGGLGARRAGRLGIAVAAALCAIGITTVLGVASEWQLQRPDWRSVAAVVGRSARDPAIFVLGGCQLLPFSLYVPGLHRVPAAGVYSTEIDLISVGSPVWYDACDDVMYRSLPPRLGVWNEVGHAQHVNRFTVVRLRSPIPERVTQALFSAASLKGELLTARG